MASNLSVLLKTKSLLSSIKHIFGILCFFRNSTVSGSFIADTPIISSTLAKCLIFPTSIEDAFFCFSVSSSFKTSEPEKVFRISSYSLEFNLSLAVLGHIYKGRDKLIILSYL
jgi:hypothetical protein